MAVESRTSPVFVHDPRRGSDLHSRFVLDGNPDVTKDWATTTIEYVEDGQAKLMEVPLTPADFAVTEGRFKKQFHKLAPDADGVAVVDARASKTPFIWSTDAEKKLIKLEVSHTLIHLVLERRKYWRTLQYLAGINVEMIDANHKAELETLQSQYKAAVDERETSLDSIARAMSELAASSNAPTGGFAGIAMPGAPAPKAAAAPAASNGGAVVALADDDVAKCSNCKTCYQDIPELFEKTKIVVDGSPKEVAHLIPGALAKVKVTPELKAKVARVAANCDSEIIHEQ